MVLLKSGAAILPQSDPLGLLLASVRYRGNTILVKLFLYVDTLRMAKMQYKIRIEESAAERLAEVAARLGYPSGNAFAADALTKYLDTLAGLIEDLQQREAEALREQQQQALGKVSAPAKSLLAPRAK